MTTTTTDKRFAVSSKHFAVEASSVSANVYVLCDDEPFPMVPAEARSLAAALIAAANYQDAK
jgi:hypothetical protein